MAYGIVIKFHDGFQLSYSGDCRPSTALIDAGKNSDLLIHEATFEDDKLGEAIEKRHSTISEAVETGVKMNAKNVLLTHFSQRYPLIPHVPNFSGPAVAYAFDLMKVRMCDFWKFKRLLPILQRVLQDQ